MSRCHPILSAHGLTARRSWRTIFTNTNIDVFPGDRIYIVGQNGSGKTTLLETILGLHKSFGGEILWKGKLGPPTESRAFQTYEAFYLPQHNNLFGSLTLQQNILVGLRSDEAVERLEEALKVIPEIRRSLDKLPSEASAGQRQIAAFLRLSIRRPLLAILDEPTAGIAESLLSQLYYLVAQSVSSRAGVIFTDQHVGVARSFATQEFTLEDGVLSKVVKATLTGG